MTVELSPGPKGGPEDALAGHERQLVLRQELVRVRAAAVAWRNGLAGLVAALLSFGLIRGRTDVGRLAAPWGVVVGALLLVALTLAGVATFWLLRAANGRPTLTPSARLLTGPAGDHPVAVAALRDLRRGMLGAAVCAGLLVAAVGTTWYGPDRAAEKLRVVVPGATWCGEVTGVDQGRLSLSTSDGRVTVDLAQVLAVKPVGSCP